jgi:hypothetical protein
VISGATAVNTRVHFETTTAHTRLRVHWAPGIPHALLEGGRFFAKLGRMASRECEAFDEYERAAVSAVIAREGGRPSIPRRQ